MTVQIGMNVAESYTAAELAVQGKGFGLGDRCTDHLGNEYVFVLAGAGGFTGDGFVVIIDEAYGALMLSTSNDARGDLAGVAKGAVAASSYAWVQVKGISNVQVLASAAANARLNTTATAGALDDDGTVGAMQVQGIYLTTARAASVGLAPGILNYPFIDVTL
jgi:hypothetical protein